MNEFRAALQALVEADSPESYIAADVAAKALLARPEPEPRITREEAMRLLDNLQTAYARMMYQKAHLGEQYDDAREACLAAMLRSEPGAAKKARPEPESTPCWVHPAPDAAPPMSPGKTFTAVATYTGMPASRPEADAVGTIEHRFSRFIETLQSRLGIPDQPFSSYPPEDRIIAALDARSSPPAASDVADAVEALARKRFYEVHNVKLKNIWDAQPEAVKNSYLEWATAASDEIWTAADVDSMEADAAELAKHIVPGKVASEIEKQGE